MARLPFVAHENQFNLHLRFILNSPRYGTVMSKVLLVHSSIFGENSQSLGLARAFLKLYPHTSLVERILTPRSIPHLDSETFAAMRTPQSELTVLQQQAVTLSDQLIGELETADTILLAAPMYNFSIPSTLKAWIDHVARSGRTFRYSEKGPEGLLKGKKVFVLMTRGGIYSNGNASLDFQKPYLTAVLSFIGLGDVTFIHFEGIGMGADTVKVNHAKALAELEIVARENRAGASR